MTFAHNRMQILTRITTGVIIAVILTVTSGVVLPPSSAFAAESRPATVRSDRRPTRERSIRAPQSSQPTGPGQATQTTPRRPQAVRR